MDHANLISKMKAHDWFYEWSEDQRAYVKGISERAEILELLVKVPMIEIEQLILDYVPEKIQPGFVQALSHYSKIIGFVKGKL